MQCIEIKILDDVSSLDCFLLSLLFVLLFVLFFDRFVLIAFIVPFSSYTKASILRIICKRCIQMYIHLKYFSAGCAKQ